MSERQETFLKFSKKKNMKLDFTFISNGFSDEQRFSVTLSLLCHILSNIEICYQSISSRISFENLLEISINH